MISLIRGPKLKSQLQSRHEINPLVAHCGNQLRLPGLNDMRTQPSAKLKNLHIP